MREKTKSFFRTVMKSGGLFGSKHLSVKAVIVESSRSQVKVVVSKKVALNAVARNRLKRRIRGIFEEISPKSLQAIFYTKKGSGELSFKELKEEVVSLIRACS